MADKIHSTLKKLSSASQSLNQASDQLTFSISEIEAALREYKLGVAAWVDIREWRESFKQSDGRYLTVGRRQRLGYSKMNGKWGLYTCVLYEEAEDESDPRLLREASREDRIAAIEKLPELLDELVKKAIETSQEAVKQAEKAKQIAAGLNVRTGA